MRSHGLVREEVEQQPTQPVGSAATVPTLLPAEEGVDSVGPSLCLPNGKPISPGALPPGASRAALQKAILTQESERLDVCVSFSGGDFCSFCHGRRRLANIHSRRLHLQPAAVEAAFPRFLAPATFKEVACGDV